MEAAFIQMATAAAILVELLAREERAEEDSCREAPEEGLI